MTFGQDFFTIHTEGTPLDPYPEQHHIDLRDEFHKIIYGDYITPAQGRPILIRSFSETKCTCYDKNTGSPDPFCPYCDGEGYLFTEFLTYAYFARNFGSVQNPATVISQDNFLSSYGYSDGQRALAFVEWLTFPDYEKYTLPKSQIYDKLFEMKVNPNGSLLYPNTKVAKWKMRAVTPHHGDGGRIEYFELGLEKENV
jgi:hypothetical protein